jgi:hypothetical protein
MADRLNFNELSPPSSATTPLPKSAIHFSSKTNEEALIFDSSETYPEGIASKLLPREEHLGTPHGPISPRQKLARMLSVECVISTASSFATLPDLAKELEIEGTVYREIGAGSCGIVYEELGECKAIKLAKAGNEELENDWQFHKSIVEAFDKSTLKREELQVPKVYEFIRRNNDEWWKENLKNFPDKERVKEQMDVLITEQILPLPEELRHAIIDEWCPEELKKSATRDQANRDCLVRVYLGQHSPQGRIKPLKYFSIRNFALHVDKIADLDMERSHRLRLAHTMGQALAVMHWAAGTDAHDVEFVLGSSPTPKEPQDSPKGGLIRGMAKLMGGGQHNYKRRAVRLWLLDFNQCRHMTRNEDGKRI